MSALKRGFTHTLPTAFQSLADHGAGARFGYLGLRSSRTQVRDEAAWRAGYNEGKAQREKDLAARAILPLQTDTGPVPNELAIWLGQAERKRTMREKRAAREGRAA